MDIIHDLLVESEILEIERNLLTVMKNLKKTLKEGVTDLGVTGLADEFDEALKRLEAAKRGLGIVNKLPSGEEKEINKKRIFANLNRLRNLFDKFLKRTQSEIGATDHAVDNPHKVLGGEKQPARANGYSWAEKSPAQGSGWPGTNGQSSGMRRW